jgi:hypothetical protein
MLFTFFLSGCSSTKPIVWTKGDVSFTSFRFFEIKPVVNATGKNDKQEIVSSLTAHFKEQFERQNLQLNNDPQIKNEVLVVESNLLNYGSRDISTTSISAASRRYTRVSFVVLETFLVNKSKSYNVARISTNKEVGYSQYTSDTAEWLLKETAAEVAKEVVQIMQPKIQEQERGIWQQF